MDDYSNDHVSKLLSENNENQESEPSKKEEVIKNVESKTKNKTLSSIVKEIDNAQKYIEKKEEAIKNIEKEIENKKNEITNHYKYLQDIAKEGMKSTKK